MNEQLLELADDELVIGWRDSEWTGIAPVLEEDVAFSSIAQNEIGHARALYELVARDLGTTADELAFDRSPAEYRCSALVALLAEPLRPELAARTGLELPSNTVLRTFERGSHTDELAPLWEEMTMVRRSEPLGVAW